MMHISIYILHNQIQNGTYNMISTMDSSDYIWSVLQCACAIWHSAVSLSHFYNCLLCDRYTRQYLRTKSGNVHVFIQGRGVPSQNICTTSCPCYGNVRYVILWQNEQTGIKQTNKHLEDINMSGSVRSEFSGGDLPWRGPNYLFYRMMK